MTMAIKIEVAGGRDELAELILFHEVVYRDRSAHWPAMLPLALPTLLGLTPFARGRRFHPLVARENGRIVAVAVALLDTRYNRHWNERLGHVVMFEALPGARRATREMLDAASEWLVAQGADAARVGFGMLEFPFLIDDDGSLPPSVLRQNAPYYHSLLKDAGCESEKGWVDYKIEVTPELVARYESALEAVRRGGFDIVPLRDAPRDRRMRQFTDVWNDAFSTHWGVSPFIEEELTLLIEAFAGSGVLDTSVMAYRGGEPIGVLWVVPEATSGAILAPGRHVTDAEKLNFLGIGVRESARGRGVNLGMASHAYLELIRRSAKWLSYTLVRDDNWPSRRTAEKLGGQVCANYMVYRRNFHR
jgi:hypothetical protein